MADKELRKMNRTELIEIIYALQQNERTLRAENADLRSQLEDRTIRLANAGSIAEAALSLNHMFESAQAAVQQYLASVQAASGPASEQAEDILAAANQRAEMLLENARAEAAGIRRHAEAQAETLREENDQEIARLRKQFIREVMDILEKNPELGLRMRSNTSGGTAT